MLKQKGIMLVTGETYRLSFTASSTVARDIVAKVTDNYFSNFSISETAGTYSFIFTYTGENTDMAKVMFLLGKTSAFAASTVTIDDVVLSVLVQDELVKNPEFDQTGWGTHVHIWDGATADATFEIINGEMVIDIANVSSTNWHIQLFQDGITLVPGTEYTITFKAKASVARDINVVLIAGAEYRQTVSLTTEMQTFSYTFTYDGTATTGKLDFEFGLINGATAGIVTLDDISMTPTGGTALPIVNSDFGQVIGWDTWSQSEDTSISVVDEQLLVNVPNVGGNFWESQLFQDGAKLIPGEVYTVIFTAKADVARDINFVLISNVENRKAFNITTEFATYMYTFVYNGTATTGKIDFEFGKISDSSVPAVVTFENIFFFRNFNDFSDEEAPVINGAADKTIQVGATFDPLAGITVVDAVDGVIVIDSSNVVSDVDTTTAGVYTVTYTVSDEAGNEATKTITITVEEVVEVTVTWTGYGLTVTETETEVTIDYAATAGNWYDNNAQGVLSAFDGNYNAISFVVTGEAGQEYLIKFEGGGQFREIVFTATGSLEVVTLDLSGLTKTQRDALNLIVVFSHINSQAGSLVIHNWAFDMVNDLGATWAEFGLTVTEELSDVVIDYAATGGNWWDNNAQAAFTGFDGTYNALLFAVTGEAGQEYLIKIEGGGQAKEVLFTATGSQELVLLDLSALTEAQRDALNLIVIFSHVNSQAGTLVVHGFGYTMLEPAEATVTWVGYGLTVTETETEVTIDYAATAGNWYDNNAQGSLSAFDGTFNAISFTVTGEAGQEYLIKFEGGGQFREIIFTATGSQEVVTLDLSGLTEVQRNALNLIVVFSHINSQAGTFVIHSWEFDNVVVGPMQLATPFGVVVNPSEVVWGAIPEASSFLVYIDGVSGSPFTVAAGTYAFNLSSLSLAAGTYDIQIKAIGDGTAYTDSEMTAVFQYVISEGPTQLATPFGVVVNPTEIVWGAIPEASSFLVYIDGVSGSPFTVAAGTYAFDLSALSLAAGTYDIQIKAVGDGTTYTDSEMTAVFQYTVS
jgi:cytochrome c oxidase assembly protein Cox11